MVIKLLKTILLKDGEWVVITFRDMHMVLKDLFTMRDDELLQDRDWIHFLGTSKLEWAVMLTSIQRQLRKHINPNITVSFDCASPILVVQMD